MTFVFANLLPKLPQSIILRDIEPYEVLAKFRWRQNLMILAMGKTFCKSTEVA